MQPICSFPDCGRPVGKARGLCERHLNRFYRKQPMDRLSERDAWFDRFLRNVDDSDPDGCWPWTGTRNHGGYGTLQINYQTWLAHRLSFALYTGDLTADATICHHCDNPPCVQPIHLYAGTQATNAADKINRGRGVYRSGEQSTSSRLTTEQVLAIRADWVAGRTQVVLAQIHGVSQGQISRIVLRRSWKHV